MNDFGFVRIATATPTVRVADCEYNVQQAISLIKQAHDASCQIVLFPELSITAYTCGDLFHNTTLQNGALAALKSLLQKTAHLPQLCVVGMPILWEDVLYNCAVAFQQGQILGVIPKTHLPQYNEFYEPRWFQSAPKDVQFINICGQHVAFGTEVLFAYGKTKIAIELCEDLWVPIPPSSHAAQAGANIILNLSASNELIGKHDYLLSLIQQQSARCSAVYAYASAGFGESSTDVVFAGNGIIAENGTILARSQRFAIESQLTIADVDIERLGFDRQKNKEFTKKTEEKRFLNIPCTLPALALEQVKRIAPQHPFVPKGKGLQERCEEIFNIQLSGLARRIQHTYCKHVVIGVSGGLDSTLALLVCVKAFDKLGIPRKGIIGITMPGFGTTNRTYQNAIDLMEYLGVTVREISIKKACEQHFSDINHDASVHDITYENSQARERTQILMDVANQANGLVIGTGDLSEMALGWATYNGDHMSMYGVNISIPKTLIKHLVHWVATTELSGEAQTTLLDIVDTPISPELLPADNEGNIAQKTEDTVGPYELHDFFLYYFIRFGFSPKKIAFMAQRSFDGIYSMEIIKKWLTVFFRRFFQQQFKRSCLPDGPKVGSIALSPRGDWRMPSDAMATLWLRECEEI